MSPQFASLPNKPDAREEIPVLDIAPYRLGVPGALEQLGAQMRRALEDFGFYFVINHGIPQDLIDGVLNAARQFCDLPLDQKMSLSFNEHHVGYIPLCHSAEHRTALDKDHELNLFESFLIKRDLAADHRDVLAHKRFRAQNQWPEGHPQIRRQIMAYVDAAERLCTSLLPLYAVALDLPADWFAPAFREPMYTLKLSHYPQQPMDACSNSGKLPYLNSSFMTVQPQSRLVDLFIRLPNGKWIDAPDVPGSLLVSGGDLTCRWTNGRFLATPYFANRKSDTEYYAASFFMDCDYDWVMRDIPSCAPRVGNSAFLPTTYFEYLTWYETHRHETLSRKDGVRLSAY
ncbi:isopenicillin N synthase family dioxygenase [Comamonas sp. MYb396]|uniref:isopenicillin N synthase family dioxygenase n=1 Tax=Comamonas sp. MYb396 TaxID=2745302 RepID=UPI0030AD80A0